MIEQRLRSVGKLSGRFEMLDQSESRVLAVDATANVAVHEFDGTDANILQMVQWLRSWGLSNDKVVVTWLGDREAASLYFDDFVDCFGDLWFPGADDVVVWSTNGSFSISIDHEEQFRLYLPTIKCVSRCAEGQIKVSGTFIDG